MPSWCCGVFFVLFSAVSGVPNDRAEKIPVLYEFIEFPYKETGRNEELFKSAFDKCESTLNQDGLSELQAINLKRQCISKSCYQKIYGHDELEEGEIDVRSNSFKGCFIQELNN